MSRPEKLAAHLFEVDEDVEKDEVSPPIPNNLCPIVFSESLLLEASPNPAQSEMGL